MRTSISQRFSASPHSAKVHSRSLSDLAQYIMRGGEGNTNYYFTILSLNGAARNHTKRFSTSVREVYTPVCDQYAVNAVTTLK